VAVGVLPLAGDQHSPWILHFDWESAAGNPDTVFPVDRGAHKEAQVLSESASISEKLRLLGSA